MEYAMPSKCAVCGKPLRVTRLACPNCGTELSGSFAPCKFCTLNDRQKLFLDTFLKCRGNIREVERTLSLSYPTVKGLLDDLLCTLFPEEKAESPSGAAQVLDRLERKEITAEEAVRLLSALSSQ